MYYHGIRLGELRKTMETFALIATVLAEVITRHLPNKRQKRSHSLYRSCEGIYLTIFTY
jgi:hypothetical protein